MIVDKRYKKGFLNTMGYYAAGFLASLIAYWIFGWEYGHAPGVHHLVGFLFLMGGAFGMLKDFILLLTGIRQRVNLGTLTVHSVFVLGFILYLVISISVDNTKENAADKANLLTLSRDTMTNTFLVVNDLNDTLYLQRGDTALVNKIGLDTARSKNPAL